MDEPMPMLPDDGGKMQDAIENALAVLATVILLCVGARLAYLTAHAMGWI